jgi:hypothetical protein
MMRTKTKQASQAAEKVDFSQPDRSKSVQVYMRGDDNHQEEMFRYVPMEKTSAAGSSAAARAGDDRRGIATDVAAV